MAHDNAFIDIVKIFFFFLYLQYVQVWKDKQCFAWYIYVNINNF